MEREGTVEIFQLSLGKTDCEDLIWIMSGGHKICEMAAFVEFFSVKKALNSISFLGCWMNLRYKL
jgi:hypothetical protein